MFRPDGESRKNAFWTQLDDVRQPGFLPCLEKPTRNGGMKPTSWYSILRVFFRFAPMGKVEKTRFERNWTTFVNPAFCPAWKSPLKMVIWNRPRGIRSQGCYFVSPRWGKSKKRVLNAIGRRSSTRLFALLWKAHSKWWYETDLVEFDPKGVFSFALMGKVEKTRFERNWTTFVNPAFCPAWKSPLKMVIWNRPRGIRSQGCYFVSPRWGKSKKRVLNAIGRRSSNRLFALLGKAHSKWLYETDLVEFDPKGVFSFRPDGESRKNAFLNAIGRRSSTRLFALLGKAYSKWWYETDLMEFDPKGVFSFRPDGESRKNAFWTQLDAVRQPGFLPCLEKPTRNGGMKPTSWNSILRVFFRFARMGKVEKTRFERNWTTFVNPAFCPAWKSPLKTVVWNRPRRIRSQWCFFVSPGWGKSKKRVLNAIGRRSSTRLFSLLGKAHSKWWYETDLVEFDPKVYTLYSVRCALYTVHCTLCTVHCALYTVHCTLCTVHYTRYTVLCALCTIHGTLDSVHCALYTVHCTLCTVHYTRYTVLCALYTVHCTLCTIHGTLYSVHYTRYTVLSALCTMHGTLYSVHCALYTVHSTLCTIHGTLYSVHYTRYTVLCALYTVHCTLCTVHHTRYTVLCAQYTVHCTLCTVHYTRYTVLCALYTIHGTRYSVHYTRYTVLCSLCTIHGTLYSVHRALCTIHGTLYSVHCALYTVH